jgi:hypothetical protein
MAVSWFFVKGGSVEKIRLAGQDYMDRSNSLKPIGISTTRRQRNGNFLRKKPMNSHHSRIHLTCMKGGD